MMQATASMSRFEMRKELFALCKLWDEADDYWEGGGSPREGTAERIEELTVALRRMCAASRRPR